MARKPQAMSQVKQILRMHSQGKGIKTIAKTLLISKNTVKGYVGKVLAIDLSIEALLALEDPVLEEQLWPGNPAYKDQRYEQLKSDLDYYHKELGKVGVTRMVLWEEYQACNPQPYSFTQFCYHLQQYRRSGKPIMVLDHKAGDKLYIDYAGKPLSYVNRATGEVIKVIRFLEKFCNLIPA